MTNAQAVFVIIFLRVTHLVELWLYTVVAMVTLTDHMITQ